MILSYRDKKTGQFAKGEFVKAFQGLNTLRALPGNHLEALLSTAARSSGFPLYDKSTTRAYGAAGWMSGSDVRPCFRYTKKSESSVKTACRS
jgi:hypothetical protein